MVQFQSAVPFVDEWGKVFDSLSRGPGVFCGSDLGQETSEPQLSTSETQERHECELSLWYDWNTVESGVRHHSINRFVCGSVDGICNEIESIVEKEGSVGY